MASWRTSRFARGLSLGVGAAARVDFAEATPELLAERIVESLRQAPAYQPVETGGSERAARLIAELL